MARSRKKPSVYDVVWSDTVHFAPRPKRKKPRKRVSHAQQLLDAAWNFVLSYYDDASNAETHEEKMVAAIRRILREARRG